LAFKVTPLNTEKIKSAIIADIDSRRSQLVKLSRKIHANPELGFKEFKSADLLTGFLAESGFSIELGICDLPTAFRASYGKGAPLIALFAEYDALPEMGHACGHNLIGVSAVGAAVASREAIDRYGGRVVVMGTPAEELYGGKVTMAERGAFDKIDAAMIVHPGTHDAAITEALACHGLAVEFFGKAAHAASNPWAGINALDAMIISFNAINSLRQHMHSRARVHGIITDGGQAANVVPAHTAGSFLVRAVDETYLKILKEKVLDCFRAGAKATGARLEYRWDPVYYAPMFNNLTLARVFIHNMKVLGRNMKLSDPDKSFGSTDFGNVSQITPGIHPSVAIASPADAVVHSPQFAQAAVSEAGMNGMLDAAKAMAMTVVDLVVDPDLPKRVRDEFLKGMR